MPSFPQALIRIENLSPQHLHSIFNWTKILKTAVQEKRPLAQFFDVNVARNQSVCLAFFEPSTRTRVSFSLAAQRLGLPVTEFVGNESTSLSKGETISETIETLIAMQPELIVLRQSGKDQVWPLFQPHGPKVINAGDGVDEHPTQALLDAFTIQQEYGHIEGKKILYVGDVRHSRVAHSGLSLFQRLGATVATCAPRDFAPQADVWQKTQHFTDLQQALSWADVCIGLRIQSERHTEKMSVSYENYKLSSNPLRSLKNTGIVMHPGPFVLGVDVEADILSDERCRIHQQVTNGVYTRMACLALMLGLVE